MRTTLLLLGLLAAGAAAVMSRPDAATAEEQYSDEDLRLFREDGVTCEPKPKMREHYRAPLEDGAPWNRWASEELS